MFKDGCGLAWNVGYVCIYIYIHITSPLRLPYNLFCFYFTFFYIRKYFFIKVIFENENVQTSYKKIAGNENVFAENV